MLGTVLTVWAYSKGRKGQAAAAAKKIKTASDGGDASAQAAAPQNPPSAGGLEKFHWDSNRGIIRFRNFGISEPSRALNFTKFEPGFTKFHWDQVKNHQIS